MKVLIYCLLTKLSKVLVSFFWRERKKERERETERDRDRQRQRQRQTERDRDRDRQRDRERQRETVLLYIIDVTEILLVSAVINCISLEMKFLFEKDSNLSLLLNI